MQMPNKTAHYQLNQWEPGDDFLRADFNEDNAKIDAALGEMQTQVAAKCEIIVGTYTGNGETNRDIYLGRAPKALLVERYSGVRPSSSSGVGGLALEGHPLYGSTVTLTDTGFTLYQDNRSNLCNNNGELYHYIAFC